MIYPVFETVPAADDLPIRVVAFYRFTPFADCEALRGPLALKCCSSGIKGTLLLASEGINGTIAGDDGAIDAVLKYIRALPGCDELDVRESRARTMPFYRMKVRIKREIVSMGQPAIDPLAVGHYVPPQDWNALIEQPDVILIDTRNDYEVAIGTFAGAIDTGTRTFRDFPAWFRDHRHELLAQGRPPRIAMFCTGGIRCEKATAFLSAEGLEEVYHLQGGILAYLAAIPEAESRWNGECFVFDERVAVGHALAPGTHGLCRACRLPVSPADRTSPRFSEGISCPACHADRSEEQRARYAERHRQTLLAQQKGIDHIGADRPE